ncbi:PQQ-binding-like beta-propeller repeat protein [Nocardiopsis sp. SBT366]|uniref:outer membrane protein assembly factor BamB family protein n=1 Tax=Nocardiopsis sp. SBT366 TaxID=1580529 RepID=UPI00066A2B88|nr:PQQ-binding-like beta-propeller repeat protein [Nocardiopsis sp. SBT366]
MRSSRVLQALTCGLAALLVAGCTGDPEPEPPAPAPEEEPPPIPTEFEGDAPPGIEGEVLRHLHGDGADSHDILDDPLGVRISSVGGAFLISSGGEDRHLLQDAATGDTLWEGEARFRGFDTDTEGASVLLMTDADDTPFVLDADGDRLWEPAEEGDLYLDGLAVRRPAQWSAEEPHGDFSVLDTEGEELWSYTFEAEDPESEDPESEDGETDADEETDREETEASADDPERLGVPVAAWDDTVLLDSGDSVLRAHSLDPDDAGELLWSVAASDEELGLPATAPTPVPQILGVFPAPQAEPEEDAEDAEDADDPATVLLRWAQPEAPSVLSAHDTVDGEPLWTLEEAGTNPVSRHFDEAGYPGLLHDPDTGTLLLSQASGEATMVAVDLVEGEVRWGLEEDDGSISPAFAHGGLVYGDSRSNEDGDLQLVLDAETMDVVGDELSAYVEAITDTGHAILVQDRQRFVLGPAPEDLEATEEAQDGDAEDSESPAPSDAAS